MAKEYKIDMDGTYMNVIEFGHGPEPLVIIAGVSLCGLEGLGNNVEKVYSLLCEDYTIYLLDRKKVIPENYNIEAMAEDIYQTIQALGITSAYIYGVSQGGMIAQYLAIDHPDLVKKMVLCSTACKATEQTKEVCGMWADIARTEDVPALNRSFFKVVYSDALLDACKDTMPELEKVGTAEDCQRFEHLVTACMDFDISDKLSKITCPVLVLGSAHDSALGADSMRYIAKTLGCEIHLYDQYDHAVYDEAPDLKERIHAFLKG